MVESGIFYSTFVDPLLKPMRKRVANEINTGENVFDIACGTGAQLADISKIASKVVGVDLSASMIEYAKKNCKKRNISNAEFHEADATNLLNFHKRNFDVAILSLALHQFEPELHSIILNEMKKVAKRIIIVDYSVPLPKNYTGAGSKLAEFLAGRDHNRNFKKYCHLGGLNQILPENGLTIHKSVLFGKNAFQLVVCSAIY